jgi:hypothetical protein
MNECTADWIHVFLCPERRGAGDPKVECDGYEYWLRE